MNVSGYHYNIGVIVIRIDLAVVGIINKGGPSAECNGMTAAAVIQVDGASVDYRALGICGRNNGVGVVHRSFFRTDIDNHVGIV